MVRIYRHVGVVEEDLQPCTTLAHVGQRLGQRVARQQPLLLELSVDPVEEALDSRLAVREPMPPLGLAAQSGGSDVVLDLVERADLAQRLGGGLRLGALGLEELSPRVSRIWCSRYGPVSQVHFYLECHACGRCPFEAEVSDAGQIIPTR